MAVANTREFALSLVGTLGESFFDGTNADERQFRTVAPANHYAATCFSVAAFRAFAFTGDEQFREMGTKALDYYLDLPEDERGHYEFNSFALLEAIEDARNDRYDLPVDEDVLADRLAYSSSFHSAEGNNWLLLQALCRAKYADLFDDRRERRRARRIARLSDEWVLDDGVIVDYPRRRIPPFQTPLTYHAKSSMMTARLATRLRSSALRDRTGATLRALSRLTLRNGEALYFGRSDNTIFGYVCAVDALSSFRANADDAPDWSEENRGRLVRFLLEQFDPDRGNCQPGHLRDDRRMDGYVYDAVYASYAAMVLLGLPAISPRSATGRHRSAIGCEHLLDAGLLAARGRSTDLGLATTGQIRIRIRGSDPDLRYAGLVPLSFVHDGRAVCPGFPVERADSVPFLPVIRHEGANYAPVLWDARVSRSDSTLAVRGNGRYYRFRDFVPRSAGTSGTDSLADRFKAAVKRRETTRRVAEAGYEGVKRLLRSSRLNLAGRNVLLRPTKLPHRTRRSLFFLPESDALVVQTVTTSTGRATVRPSSAVTSPAYENRVELTYQSDVDVARRDAVTHKGAACWHVPDRRRTSRTTWSVIVLDPADRVEETTTAFEDDALVTTVDLEADSRTFRTAARRGRAAGKRLKTLRAEFE